MGRVRFFKKGTKLGSPSSGGAGGEDKNKYFPVPPPKPSRNSLREEETSSVGTAEMVTMLKGGNLQTANAFLVKGALVNFQLLQAPQSFAGPFAGVDGYPWTGKAELIFLQTVDVKIVRRGRDEVVGGTSADEEDLCAGLIKAITEGGSDNVLQITLTKSTAGGGSWGDKLNLKLEGAALRRIGEVFGTENVEFTVELEKPTYVTSRGPSLSFDSDSDSVDFRTDVVDSPKENPDLKDQSQDSSESSGASLSPASSMEAAEFREDLLPFSKASSEAADSTGPKEPEKEDQVDGLHGITRQLLRFAAGATGFGKMDRTNEPINLLEEISGAKDLPLVVSDTDGLVYCQGTLDINRSWLKSWFVPQGFNGRYTKVAKVNMILAVMNTEPSAPEEELGGLEEAQGILAVNKKLLEEEIKTDLEIIPGNGEVAVKCYSGFLAAQSEVLKGMLNGKPERITMEDMTVEGVKALLAFLYYRGTKQPMGRMDICVELLKAGWKYRIGSLEKATKDIILENKQKRNEDWFGVEATLALFFFANGLERFWELKEKAVGTLKVKANEVVASDAYSRLFEENPSAAKELASVFLIMSY